KEKQRTIDEYLEMILSQQTELKKASDAKLQLELKNLQEENMNLTAALKKKSEIIDKLNFYIAENFKSQEGEILKIKDAYLKLENQHQFIMATASIKDSEASR